MTTQHKLLPIVFDYAEELEECWDYMLIDCKFTTPFGPFKEGETFSAVSVFGGEGKIVGIRSDGINKICQFNFNPVKHETSTR